MERRTRDLGSDGAMYVCWDKWREGAMERCRYVGVKGGRER